MEKYVDINLQFIRIVGAWDPDDCSAFQMYLSLLLRILTVTSVSFLLIPTLISIRDKIDSSSTSTMIESVIMASICGSVLCKAFSIIIRRNQLHILVSKMFEFWTNSTLREIQVMTGYAEIGRNLTKIYAIMGVLSFLAIFGHPIVLPYLVATNTSDTKLLLPFEGWKNFEAGESTAVYALLFGIQGMCTLLGSVMSIGYDCMFVVLILHVCAELRALGDTLRNITFTISGHNEIQRCAIRLNSVLQYASELDDMLHGYLLLQTCCSTINICMTGYIVSRVSLPGNNEVLKYAIYLVIGMYQLFLYCWAGNHLLSESEDVGRSAYDAYGKLIATKWENNEHFRVMSTKLPRQLQMILLRAQYRVRITAGKFYVMSLDSYKNILRTSYSYFTILRAATDPKS